MKSTIEQDKQECGSDLVLGNRISWSSYDKLRKAEGLTPTRNWKGEIGKEVVKTSHSRYSMDKETNSVVIDEVEVSARKSSLTQLREKLREA